MKKWIAGAACALVSWHALALQPYAGGTRLGAGDLATVVAAVEQKLAAAGFTTLGVHMAKGLPKQATVVVSDAGLSDAINIEVVAGLKEGDRVIEKPVKKIE
jgi:hypothetical protein